MKARTLGIVAAAGLAALAAGSINADEGYPRVVRSELPGGYIISRIVTSDGKEDLRLLHLCNEDSQYCFDKLRVWGEKRAPAGDIYEDYNADGTVDKVFLLIDGDHLRGEEGTEEIFARADLDFARYKQELGVQ